jgi:hypothetical protein
MEAATLLSFDTSLDIEKQAKQEKEIEGCKNKRKCYTAQSACLQPQQFCPWTGHSATIPPHT